MPAEYLRLQPGDHGEVNSGDEHYIPVSETFLKRISRSYFSTTTGSRKSCAIWSAITIVGILTLIIGTAVYNGFGYTDLNFQIEGDKGENLSAETVALSTPTTSKDDGADRPLILYAYHESPNARQNAIFFIHHGLHSAADFIFILNGHTNLTLLIPSAPNIRIIQRTNTCYDLGAYGELVGMTFNCEPIYGVRHLQSMIFATDRIGINTLLSVMSTCFPNWLSAVYGESNSTRAIINAGYTVSAMMTSFASQENYADECKHGDILLEGAYFGDNLHPYETIFQKANRDFGKDVLSRLTEWTDLAGYSSYEVCGKKKEELKPLGGWGRWEEARRTGYS
ncbi:hypothetical protein AOL_s00054g155 [Orbilia oligospora ATCC 24927]|uniref:Uncharacterized protein n=1 Tax=Arthrobotrys oligospora (strain ATCC 24927 / CBS 115.81 / DSM 1491) TaxID=756982 RepID=G1X5L1_ARTOA|nr:hypothetical protein AOL_s00054g155 [Orbilia oligospora ATCC 24927]EGX51456.1 hypothetical protein AOL_s00054g155 [Orbilia oligospora ATCC 24927]